MRLDSIPRFSFLKWKQVQRLGTGHSRYSCSGVGWLTSFVVFSKSWLSPYWSVLVWHSRHLVLHFEFLTSKQEMKLNWECRHNTKLLVIFYSIICITSTMDMCISLSKEIIKHPFATCPGHHSCCLSFITLIHNVMVILADELMLHKKIKALD